MRIFIDEHFIWLTEAKLTLQQLFVPMSQGRPRFDDRIIFRGLVVFSRNGCGRMMQSRNTARQTPARIVGSGGVTKGFSPG